MSEDQDVDLSFETLTFGDDEKPETEEQADDRQKDTEDDNEEPEDHVVLITTELGGKHPCPFPAVVMHTLAHIGPLKTSNYREKQSFGFLQFLSAQDVEKALNELNGLEIEGSKISAEVTHRITPGRDPRTHDWNSEFKNSTLVLKNLPFQLKVEQLETLLNQWEWKAQSVSYLYDSSGMFRGMAFVKFKEIAHAQKIFEVMNGLDILGRKLRIEYKKKVKEEAPEENLRGVMEQLEGLKNGSAAAEMAFPCSSSLQRKQVHLLADRLGLGHYSQGEGEHRYVVVKRKDSKGTPPSKEQPIKGQRSRRNSEKKNSYEPRSSFEQRASFEQRPSFDGKSGSFDRGGNLSRSFGRSPPSAMMMGRSPPSLMSRSPGATLSVGSIPTPSAPVSSGSYSSSFGTSPRAGGFFPREGPLVSPSRQPKGPDGANKGFDKSYQQTRSMK